MYVISGITGQTGSAAARVLLQQGRKVRAVMRDTSRGAEWLEKGVELFEGDLSDSAALAKAFDGADGAYVLAYSDPSHPDPLGRYQTIAAATREAALAAGLPRLVFLSSEGAHLPAGSGPIVGAHLAETILADAAPVTTFIRPSFFQENWRPLFAVAANQGVLPSMLQPLDARRSQVATADIGAAVAALLTEAAPPNIVELAGPEERSAADAAEAMAHALGREVSAVAVPREAWEATLSAAGVGPAYAALLCEMYDGINSGLVGFSGDGDSRRGSTRLDQTIASWAR